MKSFDKKIDDILDWAADFYKKYKLPIDASKKMYDYSEEWAKNYERVRKDIFKSDNDNINKLRAIGSSWNKMVGALSAKDENYFLEISGADANNKGTMHRAAAYLESHKASLIRIRELSDACVTLIHAINVADHMDVKGLAESLVTTKMLDVEGRKMAIKQFKSTINGVNRILPKLDHAILTCRLFS